MLLKQVGALAGHAIATDLLRGKKGETQQKRGQDRIRRESKLKKMSGILENGTTLVTKHIS